MTKQIGNTRRLLLRLMSLMLFAGLVCPVCGPAFAGDSTDTVTVAVLPFKVNADRDMVYLRDGIVDMMVSRLSKSQDVVVIKLAPDAPESREGVSEVPAARTLAKQLGADFVVFGSMTVFGQSASLDAKLLEVKADAPPQAFSRQTQDMGAVIPAVHALARDIGQAVTGAAAPVAPLPATPSAKTSAPPATAGAPPAAGVGFWKSRDFSMRIDGIAAADMDGDGNTEIVLMERHNLHIYRLEKGRLEKVKEVAAEDVNRFVSVDAADINNNGRPELFATRLSTSPKGLSTIVIEWDGTDFVRIAADLSYYLRVIRPPGKPPLLMGQKKALQEPFMPGIYPLAWEEGTYAPRESLPLPRSANVLGMTVGPLLASGENVYALFDAKDYIDIYDAEGQKKWSSDTQYGGSENYIAYSKELGIEGANSKERYAYFPQRLLVLDTNQDGRNELLTVSNDPVAWRVFKRVRKFGGARFISFVWDGIGLSPLAMTREVSGYISDFNTADFDGDGRLEILASVVTDRGYVFTEDRSTVIAYDITALKK